MRYFSEDPDNLIEFFDTQKFTNIYDFTKDDYPNFFSKKRKKAPNKITLTQGFSFKKHMPTKLQRKEHRK